MTSQFTQSTAATLHGAPGLRLMVHQTVLWTDRLAVTAADDGQTARCVATVSGLGANTTYIRISVNCESPPTLVCQTQAAPGVLTTVAGLPASGIGKGSRPVEAGN